MTTVRINKINNFGPFLSLLVFFGFFLVFFGFFLAKFVKIRLLNPITENECLTDTKTIGSTNDLLGWYGKFHECVCVCSFMN